MSTGHSTIKPYAVAQLRLLSKRKKVTVCGNHTVGVPFSMTTAASFTEWIITETDILLSLRICKAMNGVSKIINSKLPKNYSSYAGKLYKNSTQITARQIGKKMANSFKLGRSTGRVFEFMFSTIANVMRATR